MKLSTALILLGAMLALTLGAPLAASLNLDLNGVETTGVVTGKVERISEKYAKASRTLEAAVRYTPRTGGAEETSTLELGEIAYDGLKRGSKVALRHQPARWLRRLEPWAPATRLSGQDSGDWIRAVVSRDTVRVLVTVLGGIPVFFLWLRGRRRFFWLFLLYLLLGAFYWLTPVSEAVPTGAVRTARATVRHIHRIERILTTESTRSRSSSLPLIRPMELVELEFVPEGRTEPVVAADKITAGSFPGLHQGGGVEVTYQKDRPRIARMRGGTRDYGWTNLATLAMPWVVGLLFFSGGSAVLVALLAGLGKLFGSRRSRNPR